MATSVTFLCETTPHVKELTRLKYAPPTLRATGAARAAPQLRAPGHLIFALPNGPSVAVQSNADRPIPTPPLHA